MMVMFDCGGCQHGILLFVCFCYRLAVVDFGTVPGFDDNDDDDAVGVAWSCSNPVLKTTSRKVKNDSINGPPALALSINQYRLTSLIWGRWRWIKLNVETDDGDGLCDV